MIECPKRKENQTDEEYRNEVIAWQQKNMVRKSKNIYLCIYKKAEKLYWATVSKLTERIHITNEKMETVQLGYFNIYKHYRLNDFNDLKEILPELRKKFGLSIYILENKYSHMTQIKLIMILLGNPFYQMALEDKNIPNPELEEGKFSVRTIEIKDTHDWISAEVEFGFKSDFVDNLF